MATVNPTVKEEQLFSVIVKAASWKKLDEISIRVAGGWVRDKILDVSSDAVFVDIDIALGGINGVEFANVVKEYLEFLEDEEKIDRGTYKIGVISANPDQSKHLETVCMCMCMCILHCVCSFHLSCSFIHTAQHSDLILHHMLSPIWMIYDI